MIVNYRSNNSGGDWWLSDDDWYKLEKAGWKIEWAKDMEDGFYVKDGRYMGALAVDASIEVKKVSDAIRSFMDATGQNAMDEGCNCCGAPHSFDWKYENDKYDCVSGEECVRFVYGEDANFI